MVFSRSLLCHIFLLILLAVGYVAIDRLLPLADSPGMFNQRVESMFCRAKYTQSPLSTRPEKARIQTTDKGTFIRQHAPGYHTSSGLLLQLANQITCTTLILF